MKTFAIILITALCSTLTGCYTMVGVVEEDENYSLNNYDNENFSSSYFDEEMGEKYNEENLTELNESIEYENSNDFFTVFSTAFSDFFSSGSINVVIDLSSGSSSNDSDSQHSDNKSRNNSGSRNYDGR